MQSTLGLSGLSSKFLNMFRTEAGSSVVAAQNKTTEAGITEFLASVDLACVAYGFRLVGPV
ncbi:MAG: hypothetical protein DMF70_14775 [Acidobacteria bacterium]|nr:MAG: hypothetical protein DMF70_14775 [Acidobacteriota bacterium]